MIQGFTFTGKEPLPLLRTVVYQEIRPGRSVADCRINDAWALDYLIEGTVRIWCGGTWRLRPVRTAHLYAPGTLYKESYPNGSNLRSAFVIFTGECAGIRTLTDNPFRFAHIADPDEVLLTILRECAFCAGKSGNAGYFSTQSIFLRLFQVLASATRVSGGPETDFEILTSLSEIQTLSRRCIAYLEKHFQKKLHLAELAHELGVSVSTLGHRFREETGRSVVETLRKIRLEQSLPLLLQNIPLKEIADAVGFPNEFYYSRMFRRQYGYSPSQYRSRSLHSN